MNFLAVLVAALAPLLIGFIWYNPKVFGTAWMRSIGVENPDEMKAGANMAVIFGLSIFFALLLALSMNPLVVHQSGIMSLLADLPESRESGAKIELMLNGTAIDFTNKFRTFGHGAFHGFLYGFFIAVPLIGTNALFERRGFKYIAINAGYWIVSMIIMGGIICAWK